MSGGSLDVPVGKDAVKSVGIQRIQLEVDTGKTLHDLDAHDSCIDLNRAGCALMEVGGALAPAPARSSSARVPVLRPPIPRNNLCLQDPLHATAALIIQRHSCLNQPP